MLERAPRVASRARATRCTGWRGAGRPGTQAPQRDRPSPDGGRVWHAAVRVRGAGPRCGVERRRLVVLGSARRPGPSCRAVEARRRSLGAGAVPGRHAGGRRRAGGGPRGGRLAWPFYALRRRALAALTAGLRRPTASTNLWPEHFDIASEAGPEALGRRAVYGASPGTGSTPTPPVRRAVDRRPGGGLWNAAAFDGAELGYAELEAAEDPTVAFRGFITVRFGRSSPGPGPCAAGYRAAVRFGVLTGGGDCPGLNAAIRAIVRKGIDVYGHEIVGFRDGWQGPSRTTPGGAQRRVDPRHPSARWHDTRHLSDEPVQAEDGPSASRRTWRASPRRPDRDRRRGHAGRRGPASCRARSTRRSACPRRSTTTWRDRRHLRLRHGAPGRDRGDRPPAHDRRVAPPSDGGRGDGPPRRAGSRCTRGSPAAAT